jgi:hypothetical protein
VDRVSGERESRFQRIRIVPKAGDTSCTDSPCKGFRFLVTNSLWSNRGLWFGQFIQNWVYRIIGASIVINEPQQRSSRRHALCRRGGAQVASQRCSILRHSTAQNTAEWLSTRWLTPLPESDESMKSVPPPTFGTAPKDRFRIKAYPERSRTGAE